MSHLDEHVDVGCALAQADVRLNHFFRAHGNADGDTAKLTLAVDVNVSGFATPLTLERSVIATIQTHHLRADMTPRYDLQWAPQVSGPFPLFAGQLIVEAGDDYDTFVLHLRGDYTPPLGVLGKGFDLAVGHRLAQATAYNLLHRIRDFIESEFARDEARKPHGEPQARS